MHFLVGVSADLMSIKTANRRYLEIGWNTCTPYILYHAYHVTTDYSLYKLAYMCFHLVALPAYRAEFPCRLDSKI